MMAGLSGTSAGVPVASLSGEEEVAERRKKWRERGMGRGEERRGEEAWKREISIYSFMSAIILRTLEVKHIHTP